MVDYRKIISYGKIETVDAAIINLDQMKYNEEYDILIEGKPYGLKLSDDNHLWFFKKEGNQP